ncbi:MAG: carboxypeptidase-like regulatory domain-containing protein [Candidatus ainarchaeum sp.]|nr:carboxypeptidase-like regulatory domain-containing protein [Candidatus ainarchaeum sp.]
MGVFGGIKSIYFACEDKWYAFWDKVDGKIPVYGVIEKIDKAIPSFALFLIIIAALIIFASWGFIGGIFVQYNFGVAVTDSDGNPLPNVQIEILQGDKSLLSEATNETGETGTISLPLGATVKVTATKEGFLEATREATIEKPNQKLEIALQIMEEEKEITVLIKDQYNQPVTDAVVITFACKNSSVTPPTEKTITNGRLSVIAPAGCGGLIATLDSSRYAKISSKELQTGEQTVFLKSIDNPLSPENPKNGTLRVQLKYNNEFVSDTVTVSLYKDNGAGGIGPLDTEESLNGIAEFTKAPGTYFAKTGSTSLYGQAVSGMASIESEKTATIEIALHRNIAGIVKLQLKDESSKQAIADALVSLKKGNDEIESKKSDENGIAIFSVMEDASYTAIIDSEQYCLKVLGGLRINNAVQAIELKKYASDCGAGLKAKVLDQDGKAIKGAIVGLYSEEGYSTGFATRISDLNGIAEFTRVSSGVYKAFATKGSFSGWSDAENFQQRIADQTMLIVTMIVPDGTLKINVMDKDGLPLPGANVTFIDAITNETIGGGSRPVDDANGTTMEFLSRADKKVFFTITKPGYADFTSIVYPIIPNTTQEISAVMEKEIISGEIKIELQGLYKEGQLATVLMPGETYTAKLKIKIPKNRQYAKIGLHVRTGTNNLMESDPLVIKELNVPGRASIIKATAFRPDNSYEEDSQTITTDDAKWANAEWTEFHSGIIEAEATIKVKETAKDSDELVFWYRAYAVDASGKYIRDKEDKQLGFSENTPKKQALYAEAYQAVYNVGTETLCDGTFCFSASILDIEAGLSESAQTNYTAKLYKDYLLTFAILNASQAGYFYGSELRIINEDNGLELGSYSINSAQNQNISGTGADSKTDWIAVGDFLPNTSIKGNIGFVPQKNSISTIKFQIRSAQRIVFEKIITINVEAKKEFAVTIAPEFLPTGVENRITVTVLDKETSREVSDATVKIENKFRDVLATAKTNSKGIAVLTLPAQQPGETLLLVVEKAEYKPFEKEIGVDDKVAALLPEKIGIGLNAKTLTEGEAEFSIENKSGMELVVSNLELKGRLLGLVDAQEAKNWLDTFLGETISAKQAKNFSLKARLTEAGKQVTETKTIEATLSATVTALGGEWTYEIPVVITIGLGGEVDDPSCFKITKHEWKSITEGQTIETEFEVQNNCAVSGNPVALNDIEAQINWQSNETGTFAISSQETQAELVSGYFKRILGRLEAGEKINVTLSFAPSSSRGGEAKAEIIFKASNPSDKAVQELTDKLSVQIKTVNLLNCIGFDKEIITIKPEGTGSFTIETNGCGETTDFRLVSDLELSRKTFSLKDKDKITIDVIAQGAMAGQYVVSVFAKSSIDTEERFIKNIRARVQSKGCIELSKFEFDVYKNPEDQFSGYDTAILTNHCYDKLENIEVTWSEKDMGKAQDEGMQFAMIMGMTNMMGKMGSPTQIFSKASEGESSDWCMLDGGTVLYKKSGSYYDSSGKQYVAPPEGMCHPWGKTKIYDCATGKQISEEYGYISGTSLLGQNGQARTDLLSKDGKLCKNVSPANSAETSKPAGTGDIALPVTGMATTPAADTTGNTGTTGATADTGGNTGSSGTGGTYAGRPADKPSTIIEPPSKTSKDSSSNGLMDNASLPLLLGMSQMGGGEPNFLASAIQGYMMGTQMAYSKQGEGQFSYESVQKDLVYSNSKLLLPGAKIEKGKYSQEESSDIVVKEVGDKSTDQREDNPALNIEKRKIAFINEAGVVQSDPSKPIFRVLQVRGERVEYETQYDYKEETKPTTIKVKSRTPYVENFRVQFNSFKPTLTPIEAGPVPNCQLGAMSGVTGKDAVPKVLLQWDWASINENSCDAENPNYVYCDATQFSIEILKKLEKVKNFVEQFRPFDCPTSETAAAVSEQALSELGKDFAITKMQAQSAGTDANIVVTIESNNQEEASGNITITIKDSNGPKASKKIAFSVLSREIVSATFTGLPAGNYDAEASIEMQSCAGCENSDATNDSIKAKLNMTSSGVGKCTPYSTKRLKDFLEASEFNGHAAWTQAQKEEVLNALNFNAYLIKDSYPEDFRKDFHEYCMHKSFFDCPETYTKKQGWGEFFSSKDNFKFDYGSSENSPVPAGKYNAVLDIEFNNSNWNFFDEEGLGATVKIELTQLDTPRPDNAFYYLPFDGKIGLDSENGRQGYGVNYKSGSEIKINNSDVQLVTTTAIPSSTPVSGAWVTGEETKTFKTLNADKRGIIMDIKATDESTKINLSPSYATPVIMNVSYSTGENAYGFYSVEIDNSPQSTLSRMMPWNGIGVNCKDFKDAAMTDAWQNNWDLHGGIPGNIKCATGTEITDYGVEWCSPSRKGNVYLWGIIFTPQGSNSIMKRKTYSDSMQLIGTDSSGTQIGLNGVPGQTFNSYGVSGITSVEDILKLVKESKVCVVGSSNRVSSQFFWNPKPVLDALADKKKAFEKECIPAQ